MVSVFDQYFDRRNRQAPVELFRHLSKLDGEVREERENKRRREGAFSDGRGRNLEREKRPRPVQLFLVLEQIDEQVAEAVGDQGRKRPGDANELQRRRVETPRGEAEAERVRRDQGNAEKRSRPRHGRADEVLRGEARRAGPSTL